MRWAGLSTKPGDFFAEETEPAAVQRSTSTTLRPRKRPSSRSTDAAMTSDSPISFVGSRVLGAIVNRMQDTHSLPS
jgi:hypothetical protein